MNSFTRTSLLFQLAKLYDIQTAYYDISHFRQSASIDCLLAILQSLGAPVSTLQDIPSAWRERQQALWRRPVEPVIVAWDNKPCRVEIRLLVDSAEATLTYHLKLETGGEIQGNWHSTDGTTLGMAEIEGARYVARSFQLPGGLPQGYHQVVIEVAGKEVKSLIISAPTKAYTPAGVENRRWGGFLPLYSLRSRRNWGCGDYSDLDELMRWTSRMGGDIVATLPLLTSFLDNILEPSPYLPVSRLFWNELYLDINKMPELRQCPSAERLMASSSFQDEIEKLRKSPSVDYLRQMALKRRVIEELSHYFFSEGMGKSGTFQQFIKANPTVEDYARFRATGEKRHTPWRLWPQPLREGILQEGDYDEANWRYHLYVQWQTYQQIASVSKTAKENGTHLYLDLPLGVHPDGYDVWCEQSCFAEGTAAGAPPDAVFTRGQNWEFPPLHPIKIREQGYRYVIAYLRHHLQHASILRIDHVMGLHRLFCIPHGMEPGQGVYLRYRSEELYAILTLESWRNKTLLVGEDLGIVPSYVRPAMKKHGLYRMYVMHYELATDPQKGPSAVPMNSVASLNTHDMPLFAAFWQGLDIEERLKLGLLDKKRGKNERRLSRNMKTALTIFLQNKRWLQEPEDNIGAVIEACLSFLAASPARIVLINLEDLWQETQPQNMPSTKGEYPNWRRKTRYLFEEFCQLPQVTATLQVVDKLRKQTNTDDGEERFARQVRPTREY